MYMVKWKLLIRKVTTKESSRSWKRVLNEDEEKEF
jgi:hypothetical protein